MDINYNLQWFFENIITELEAAKFLQGKGIIPQNVCLFIYDNGMNVEICTRYIC